MQFPSEWTEKKFEDVATLQRGKDLPKQSRGEGSYPILGSNGICGYHSEFVSEGPGVVTGRSGSIGGSYYANEKFWPLNTALWVKDFHGNLPLFVHYFFQSFDFARFKAGVSVPTLNRNLFSNELVTIPPLPEQRSIAAVLAKIQEAIAAQQEVIDRTRELKKALMVKLFTEGLRGEPTKETEIGPVPASWNIMRLSECAYVQTGIAKGRAVPANEAVTVPYLRVANVQDSYLDLSEMKEITIRQSEQERFLLRKDDIVLTEGGDFDKLGRGFIWKGEVEDCIHQNHIFAVRVQRDKLLPEFFAYQSQSHYGKTYFLSVAHKTTNLACINTTKLKAFPVLIPTLKVQEEIVEILSTLDRKLASTILKEESIQDLFKTMLHELMTGNIRTTGLS